MTEKQQQLLFDKGITNVPSDALCSDNALEESLGMVYDNGEHRVIQKPEETNIIIENNGSLLYVHRFSTYTRYIYKKLNYISDVPHYDLKWTYGGSSDTPKFVARDLKGDDISVVGMGKVLIIRDNGIIKYALWKGEEYIAYDNIPEQKVYFELSERTNLCVNKADCSGMIRVNNANHYTVEQGKQEECSNVIMGLYAKNKKSIAKSKCFCLPFFVRTALKLYDGTYTHISNPILLFPSVTANTFLQFESVDEMVMKTFCCDMRWENKSFTSNPESQFRPDLFDDWKDIVKEITVFISKGTEIYYTTDTMPGIGYINPNNTIADGVYRANNTSTAHGGITTIGNTAYSTFTVQKCGDGFYSALNRKSNDILLEEIPSDSVFYKAFSIGLNDLNGSSYNAEFSFEDLTTHERLEYDDYFSYSKINAETTFVYNGRLNLSGVRRGFFDGFDFFTDYALSNTQTHYYKFFVTIAAEEIGTIVVSHSSRNRYLQGLYFYYPDSRAKHVEIYKDGTRILDADLKEHHGLNGSFYFYHIPNGNDEPTATSSEEPSVTINPTEYLADYIITSSVNNPFIFPAEGYYKVGFGGIIGMSTITQALSEGQFGQFPLIVFSKSGMWAMEIGKTGYFTNHHPISREVCNNAKSITQTDGAVFFTSDKGLMVVVGSQVKCVSEQMSGRTNCFSHNQFVPVRYLGNFNEYLENAIMAYDYRDSLLWIFNPSYLYCYVYSIKSGTFGRFGTGQSVTSVVNNYPDYLLQKYNDSNKVFSLLDRKDINKDEEIYNNLWLFTRPMKLENSLAMKSIMQVLHIKDFKPYTVEETTTDPETHQETTTEVTKQGAIVMRLFASNNLTNWVELKSLRGTPWKYYRMWIKFDGLRATDRYSGAIIVTQERRTDKLR